MKKQNVRTISLIVCTFTYLLVGAALFDKLESDTERKRFEALQQVENKIIKKYNITEDDFKVMELVVLKLEPHKAGQQWKFTGAFYYATTVLTTIGYGHSTPATVGGKLFTMCYAMVGIPLGLVMFQSIGERVNRLSSFLIQQVKKSLNHKHTQASELDLICVVTTLSSLTIAGGAAAFSKFEGWSFGDMVALQKDNALNSRPEYVVFALVFILFGLAIVAASLNLLVLRFVTMNTEDERRDLQAEMQALQVAVKLEGDVITANDSSTQIHRIGTETASLDGENASICSCHCACFSASRHRKHKFHVRHSPSHNMKNLLPPAMPMQDFTSYRNPHLILQPQTLPTDLPPIYQPQHRASI
uniref:CSON004224 protein n=1 Tax=Culicoides sonorensis TaxID=179676 RepID=A0A336MNA0_CULSO